MEEASREETTHSAEEGVATKCAWTDKSDTEMDIKVEGEAGTSQLHSKRRGT